MNYRVPLQRPKRAAVSYSPSAVFLSSTYSRDREQNSTKLAPLPPTSRIIALTANTAIVVWTAATTFRASDAAIAVASAAALLAWYVVGRFVTQRATSSPEEWAKSRAWLLTFASALCLTVVGAPLAARLTVASDADFLAATHADGGISRHAVIFFAVEMILDLAIGSLDYPGHLDVLSGWAHHTFFLLAGQPTLAFGASGFFLGMSIVELPTLLLAVGSLNRPWRVDLPFGISFFLLRIVYTTYYFVRLVLISRLRMLPAFVAIALLLNAFWFRSWLVSYAKLRSKRAAGGAPSGSESVGEGAGSGAGAMPQHAAR